MISTRQACGKQRDNDHVQLSEKLQQAVDMLSEQHVQRASGHHRTVELRTRVAEIER